MSFIYGEFESEYRDEPKIVGAVAYRSGSDLVCHDQHTGNMTVARCLGNSEGAEVYRFDNLSKEQEVAMRKIGELLIPENVYEHILPWLKSEEVPYTLDSGEPGKLTIVHRPSVSVATIRAVY